MNNILFGKSSSDIHTSSDTISMLHAWCPHTWLTGRTARKMTALHENEGGTKYKYSMVNHILSQYISLYDLNLSHTATGRKYRNSVWLKMSDLWSWWRHQWYIESGHRHPISNFSQRRNVLHPNHTRLIRIENAIPNNKQIILL